MMTDEMLPSFGNLSLGANNDGWGPSDIPEGFKDMPYQPFSKDTRLGKIADWCGSILPDMKAKNRYVAQFGGGAQYAYYHDEDDSNFQLANTGRDPKSAAMRQRFKFQMRGRGRGNFQQGYGGRGGGQFTSFGNYSNRQRLPPNDRGRGQINQQKGRFGNQRYWQQNRRGGNYGGGGNWRHGDYNRRVNRGNRNPSVAVREDWIMKDELEFSQFSSLSLPTVQEPITLVECGSMKYYDKSYDTIKTRSEKPLVRFSGAVFAFPTTEDPIIKRLRHDPSINVFCTDRMAAAIMCAPKSVDSWDLLAIRSENKLIFDVRPGSNFNDLTVAETAIDPPVEDAGHINSPEKLNSEATLINVNFSQQVLQRDGKTFNFEHKNPFIDSEDEGEVASVGYRYRKFDLGNGIRMVVRCEVDAVMPSRGDDEPAAVRFGCIKALNELDAKYCNGVNWRAKLDTQRAAVIASELKNNACKLAKWTVASIMAGADMIKFGFVSRANPAEATRHVILGTQEFRPNDFAKQMNFQMDNAWGILRCVIDYFMKCDPGTYLMMKNPNKPSIQIYTLPPNAFGSDDDDSEDEEEKASANQTKTEEKECKE